MDSPPITPDPWVRLYVDDERLMEDPAVRAWLKKVEQAIIERWKTPDDFKAALFAYWVKNGTLDGFAESIK